jgi:hypothetical protein
MQQQKFRMKIMKILIKDNKIKNLKAEKDGKEIKKIKILMTQLLHNLNKANSLTCFNNYCINNKRLMVASIIHLIGNYQISKIFKKFRD